MLTCYSVSLSETLSLKHSLFFKGHTMNDSQITVQELKKLVQDFVHARDWQQFHNAKNVSMAIAIEAAELMEHFLWVDGKESGEKMLAQKEIIQEEIVDIMWMVLCLCNKYDIDLISATHKKMAVNAQHYPVDKTKRQAKKYTEL
jgi:dCTP diphosphatase